MKLIIFSLYALFLDKKNCVLRNITSEVIASIKNYLQQMYHSIKSMVKTCKNNSIKAKLIIIVDKNTKCEYKTGVNIPLRCNIDLIASLLVFE